MGIGNLTDYALVSSAWGALVLPKHERFITASTTFEGFLSATTCEVPSFCHNMRGS